MVRFASLLLTRNETKYVICVATSATAHWIFFVFFTAVVCNLCGFFVGRLWVQELVFWTCLKCHEVLDYEYYMHSFSMCLLLFFLCPSMYFVHKLTIKLKAWKFDILSILIFYIGFSGSMLEFINKWWQCSRIHAFI